MFISLTRSVVTFDVLKGNEGLLVFLCVIFFKFIVFFYFLFESAIYKVLFELLSDCSLLTSLTRIFHSYGEVTIAGENPQT